MPMQLFFVLADMSIQPTDARTIVLGTDNAETTAAELYVRAEAACAERGMMALFLQPITLPPAVERRFRAALATWLTWYDDLVYAFTKAFFEQPVAPDTEGRLHEIHEGIVASVQGDQDYFIWLIKSAARRCRRRLEGME